MGKGSKQRRTAAAFYDNFDKIFGAKAMTRYKCERCGGEDVDEFNPAYCDTCDD